MPGGDGTGPEGLGPGTGRAAGYCSGFSVPGFANPVPRGGGRGRRWTGAGPGYRYRTWAAGQSWIRPGGAGWPERRFAGLDAEDELRMLRVEIEGCERALEGMRKRVGELERNGSEGE